MLGPRLSEAPEKMGDVCVGCCTAYYRRNIDSHSSLRLRDYPADSHTNKSCFFFNWHLQGSRSAALRASLHQSRMAELQTGCCIWTQQSLPSNTAENILFWHKFSVSRQFFFFFFPATAPLLYPSSCSGEQRMPWAALSIGEHFRARWGWIGLLPSRRVMKE